ncbi:hypothetical protein BN7874_258 [Phage NCTB]|jgi:hypothetical protein|nr:hypothetical protein BN7874_258 [Phage NCTB]
MTGIEVDGFKLTRKQVSALKFLGDICCAGTAKSDRVYRSVAKATVKSFVKLDLVVVYENSGSMELTDKGMSLYKSLLDPKL